MKYLVLYMVFILAGCENSISIEEYKTYGVESFSKKHWALSSSEARASMIYDYLSINQPINKLTKRKILSDLGEPTAYYIQEHFPAYKISHDGQHFTFGFIINLSCMTEECTSESIFMVPD